MAIQAVEMHDHTIADLLAIPDDGKRYELIDGKIVAMGTSSDKHAALGSWLHGMIFMFLYANKLGGLLKGADGTYQLDAKNARVPDVSYVTADTIAARRESLPPGTVFTPFAPDLAIEIRSPSQSRVSMSRLAPRYLNAGSRLVWVIDFEDQTVLVCRAGEKKIQLDDENDTLDCPDLLPGFIIRLGDLWAAIADLW